MHAYYVLRHKRGMLDIPPATFKEQQNYYSDIMKLPVIILTTLCALSSLCGALDLSAVNTSLTRDQADSLFKSAYRYTVLEDLSVRREWSDAQHTLKLDFEISKDSLVMAELDYAKPVDRELASKDADAIAGMSVGKWQRAKAEQGKVIGLESCYFARTEDNRFFFIEVDKDKKATCLIYFASSPRVNRRELEAASTDSYSAMGTSSTSEAAKVVNEDEEFRLAQFVKNNKKTTRRGSNSAASSRASSAPSKEAGLAATRPAQQAATTGVTSDSQTVQSATAEVQKSDAPAAAAPAALKETGFVVDLKLVCIIGGVIIVLLVVMLMMRPKPTVVYKRSTPKRVSRLR